LISGVVCRAASESGWSCRHKPCKPFKTGSWFADPIRDRYSRTSIAAQSGARLIGAALYKIVRCLGEDVGLKTRPHGIRHATITQRIASGMTLLEVQDFSRRSDNKTLMIYNDRLENAAGRLAALADSGI
jgi:hypothetical protein